MGDTILKTGSSFAVLCTALLVSACAAPKEIEPDQKSLAGVDRIAVVGPSDPVPVGVTTENEIDAQRAVAAAAAIPVLGVLGAAVAGGVAGAVSAEIARETSEPLAKKAEAENYKLGDAIEVSLVDALKNEGYDASEISIPQKKANELPDNYDSIKDQADVVLDATATAVCSNVDSGDQSHFRPVVTIDVRLERTADKTVLMRKHFVLDDAVAKPDAYHFRGDTQYDLPDYDALKADVGKCLDGVKAAVPLLAQGVAATLAHQTKTAAAEQ